MKKLICSLLLIFSLGSISFAQTFKMDSISTAQKDSSINMEVSNQYFGPFFSTRSSDTWLDVLFDIFFLNAILVTYDDYPYATPDTNYIIFGVDESLFSGKKPADGGQFYKFAFDTSFFLFPNKTVGNETRVEGIIWKFFGPIFQIDTSVPFSSIQNKNMFESVTMNMQLGVQFALVQTFPASLYFTICWHRVQNTQDAMNGVSFQAIFRSYPVKPILLEWRGTLSCGLYGKSNSRKDLNWESHLEIGMMMSSPFEVFAAWRYMYYPVLDMNGHGVEIGARYHI